MNEALQLWCRRAGVLLGAGVLSAACLADQGPKWTYVEGGYSRIDFDDIDADGDLVGLGGSLAVTDLFHVFASYGHGNVDVDGPGDVDVDQIAAGAGINYPISDTVDLVGQAAWVRAEVGPFEENGVGLFGGVRAMLSPQFELNGGLSYVDIDDSDETSLDLGMVYSFTDMFAVSAGASIGDESTSYGIGLRLYFQ